MPLAAVLRRGEPCAVQRVNQSQAWSFGDHGHNAFSELVFVESGTVTHRWGSGQTETLSAGTVLWIRERDCHQLWAPRLRYWNLVIPTAELLRLDAYLGDPGLFLSLNGAPRPPTLSIGVRERRRLAADLAILRRQQGTHAARRTLAALLIAWLPRFAAAAEPPAKLGHPAWLPRLLAEAEARLQSGLRVAHLPRLAGVSPAHLSRCFRRHLGLTPSAWLTRIRIDLAARLLAEDDRNVLDIALHLGFASPAWFHRTFRRAYGVTPAAWRRRYRQNGKTAVDLPPAPRTANRS